MSLSFYEVSVESYLRTLRAVDNILNRAEHPCCRVRSRLGSACSLPTAGRYVALQFSGDLGVASLYGDYSCDEGGTL